MMKGWKIFFLLAVASALAFGFTSCDLFELIFGGGEPPFRVNLVTQDGRNQLASDEPIGLTATVDPSGYPVSWEWSIDSAVVNGVSEPIVWYRGLAEMQRTVNIQVVATDYDGNMNESSIALTISPSASIRIENQSGLQIRELYFAYDANPAVASTTLTMYENEYLNSQIFPAGGSITIFGVPSGNYDFAAFTAIPHAGTQWWDDVVGMARMYFPGIPWRFSLSYNGAMGTLVPAPQQFTEPKNELNPGNPPWSIKY